MQQAHCNGHGPDSDLQVGPGPGPGSVVEARPPVLFQPLLATEQILLHPLNSMLPAAAPP